MKSLILRSHNPWKDNPSEDEVFFKAISEEILPEINLKPISSVILKKAKICAFKLQKNPKEKETILFSLVNLILAELFLDVSLEQSFNRSVLFKEILSTANKNLRGYREHNLSSKVDELIIENKIKGFKEQVDFFLEEDLLTKSKKIV